MPTAVGSGNVGNGNRSATHGIAVVTTVSLAAAHPEMWHPTRFADEIAMAKNGYIIGIPWLSAVQTDEIAGEKTHKIIYNQYVGRNREAAKWFSCRSRFRNAQKRMDGANSAGDCKSASRKFRMVNECLTHSNGQVPCKSLRAPTISIRLLGPPVPTVNRRNRI